MSVVIGHRHRAAVGGIDVEPDAVAFTDVRDRIEWIDRACPCRAGRPDDSDGAESRVDVGGEHLFEAFRTETEPGIRRDLAHTDVADAEDLCRSLDRVMHLL